MMLVALSFVASEGVLRGFVRCKIDGMRGTCTLSVLSAPDSPAQCCLPAPITTLDNPLHNDQKPSARDMVTMAFEMPLYMALGDGLTICILVYRKSAHCWQWTKSLIESCAP